MAHLILTGATGLVGSAVLAHTLSLPVGVVTKLSILSRRPVPMAEGKSNVEVIIHKDYDAYDSQILERLDGASGCIWAQGISVNQVTKEEYKKITIDYPISAAKAFSTLSDNFKFVYVSGEGATTSPGVLTSHFGKIKGQAELDLIALSKTTPSLKPFGVRPAVVDSQNHPEVIDASATTRNVPLSQKILVATIVPAIRACWANGLSPTAELGKFLVDLAMSDGLPLEGSDIEDGRIIPNKAVRRLAREKFYDGGS
ncbi:hypothetical protein EJ08DRAFT_724149 [Tothia fuscella]|uniref:Nucleoside-diphosphate sugar epimerase n=1 Tax=Tothia fuscella TaxID=1048955 RepID=A0A9P4P1A6_9PEZI|nr:hypothetical protein EJ08DRAFT_724149 [Tothia fuscella]